MQIEIASKMASVPIRLISFGLILITVFRDCACNPVIDEHTQIASKRAHAEENDDSIDSHKENAAVVFTNGVPNFPELNDGKIQDQYNEPGSLMEEDNADSGLKENSIQKRLISTNEWHRWKKGIVPYTLKMDIGSSERVEAHASMLEIEKHTCIRFVPWVENKTKEKYELHDESHINFEIRKGCSSTVGDYHLKRGQGLSCCNRVYCMHELGHTLGLEHEQNSPLRHGWLRFNYQNIEKKNWGSGKIADPETSLTYRYDITGKMHYNSLGAPPSMSIQFKDLQGLLNHRENTYYFYMDIAGAYKCKEQNCSSFNMTCVNDGFVSLVDEKCACMCPPGLDPATGCSNVRKHRNFSPKWPRGSYGMFAPTEGCPGSNEFQEGRRTHYSDGNSWTSGTLHLKGVFTKKKFNYTFCTKEGETAGPSAEWERGSYCIFRKNGTCPKDFQDGYIKFDDTVQSGDTVNSLSGVLPDGDFGNDTQFQFCCRDDGFVNTPIHLPNTKPFILFNKHLHKCQKVDGMYAVEEFLSFDVDDSSGLSESNGSVPYFHIWGKNWEPRFCYYAPLKTDCGGVIDLTRESPVDNFTSPNYPGLYDNAMECVWLVKGPKDSNILLTFEDFNIERRNKRSCKDSLVIRYALIGQNAFEYCGDGDDTTYRSIENLMTLTFRTDLSGQRKGFKARVRLALPENHCFNQQDKGLSYRGNVSFTRDFQTCLPWSAVTNCTNHLFKSTGFCSDFDDGLEENYCRNPDNTFRPWCFTSIQDNQCERNYCDVCLLETRYDNKQDCEKMKAGGLCPTDKAKAIDDCAKTCSPPFPAVIVKNCARPDALNDADPVVALNTSYAVGDTVSFKCRTGSETLTQRCLSDGTWSPGGYVCGACSTGWAAFNGSCYKYSDNKQTYFAAERICKSYNGTVATAKTEAEQSFVASLGFIAWDMWLGATDREKEGSFVWSDGSPVTWENWKKDQPDNWAHQEDCTVMFGEHRDSLWNDISCSAKYRFVCKITPSARILCADRHPDCQSVVTNNSVCTENQDFAWQQCPKTCGICQ